MANVNPEPESDKRESFLNALEALQTSNEADLVEKTYVFFSEVMNFSVEEVIIAAHTLRTFRNGRTWSAKSMAIFEEIGRALCGRACYLARHAGDLAGCDPIDPEGDELFNRFRGALGNKFQGGQMA